MNLKHSRTLNTPPARSRSSERKGLMYIIILIIITACSADVEFENVMIHMIVSCKTTEERENVIPRRKEH